MLFSDESLGHVLPVKNCLLVLICNSVDACSS